MDSKYQINQNMFISFGDVTCGQLDWHKLPTMC